MAIFLYTAPCFTALGLHLFAPGERLQRTQWAGVGLAFAGIALAFADGFLKPRAPGASVLAGISPATRSDPRRRDVGRDDGRRALDGARAGECKQDAVLPARGIGGRAGRACRPVRPVSFAQVTPVAVASLAYQSVIVAFVSYLSWFWLLTRYSASRLSVFTFLSPLFGVAFGVLLLGESVGWRFMSAAALVLTGIALVNAPPRRRA